MKPKTVTIKNFKSFGDKEIKFDLESNAVKLIVGKNGVGKTSIMDAIIWVLFGKNSSSADKVVNRTIGKDCKVEFLFTDGNNEYCIIRYRKHTENSNSILIFKDSKNISFKKNVDSQNFIDNIVGITYESMVASVMFSGEKYSSFLKAKGSERLKIFDGILSLKQINNWGDTSKALRKPELEKQKSNEIELEKILFGISTIESNIEEYTNNAKSTLIKMKEDKLSFEEKIKSNDEKIKEYSSIDLTEEFNKLEKVKEIKEFNKVIEDKLSKSEELKKEEELLIKINSVRTFLLKFEGVDIKESKEEIARNEKLKLSNEKNRLKVSELENKKKPVMIKHAESLSIKTEIEELNKTLNKTIEEKACPMCNQIIDKDISKNILKKLSDEVEEKSLSLEKLNKEIAEDIKENEKIEKEIQNIFTLVKDITQIGFTVKELDSVIEKSNSLSFLEREYETNSEFNKKILEDRLKLKSEIKKVPENSKYSFEWLNKIKDEIKLLEEDSANNEIEVKSILDKTITVYDKGYIEGLKEKIQELNKEVEKLKKKQVKISKMIKHFDYLVLLFSNNNSGVKKYIISKMIALFNDKVNDYLPLYFDEDVKIEFDKNLVESITINGGDVEFEEFSSGEKKRLELAVALSMFMLVKTFYSNSVNFIVFDEILDGALDSKGINSTVDLIKDLGENNSVFVISHRDDLKEHFQNRIYISKDRLGFAKIEFD